MYGQFEGLKPHKIVHEVWVGIYNEPVENFGLLFRKEIPGNDAMYEINGNIFLKCRRFFDFGLGVWYYCNCHFSNFSHFGGDCIIPFFHP